jgi:hypothetical protein
MPDSPPPPPSPLFGSSQAFDAVAAGLHRAAGGVDLATHRQAEAARLIRLGRMDEAFTQIAECLGLWQDVQASLAAAAAAINQPVERLAALVLTSAPDAAADPIADLTAALNEVKKAVKARDWVGLADALEYDLGELAQRWRSALLQPDAEAEPARAGPPRLSRSAPAA